MYMDKDYPRIPRAQCNIELSTDLHANPPHEEVCQFLSKGCSRRFSGLWNYKFEDERPKGPSLLQRLDGAA
jgi:hypothetical protein